MTADAPPTARERSRGPLGFRIIGALKLASGLALFAAWLGMFRLFKSDLTTELEWAIRHLKLDPENHVFHMAFDWVGGLDRKQAPRDRGGNLLLCPPARRRGDRTDPRARLGRLPHRRRHQRPGPVRVLRDLP